MKKYSSIVAAIILISKFIFAQTTVIIGPGWAGTHAISSQAPSNAVPYNFNDKSVHVQFVYTAAELVQGGASGPMLIDSIGWCVYSQIAGSLNNYTIKMKNTTAANSAVYDGTNLTTVRNSALLNPATDTSWYMIKLTTPFQWDGTSSLLIDVCWGLNNISSATGQIRHISFGGTTERILVKSSVNSTCTLPSATVASFKPYIRIKSKLSTSVLEKAINKASIFPNPSSGELLIDFGGDYETSKVKIYNSSGSLLVDQKFENKNNVHLLTQLPQGVYLVWLERAGNSFEVYKWVVL